MQQYLDLLTQIIDTGTDKGDRTGYGTRAIFAPQMRFDLSKGFPLVTTKKMPFKMVAEELFWFLKGSSSIHPLLERNVHIWSSDALRHNLEGVIATGVIHQSEVDEARSRAKDGDITLAKELIARYEHKILDDEQFADQYGRLGPVYGPQWRGTDGAQSPDQIAELEQMLKDGGLSRRMIVSAWNPKQVPEMALPPCHALYQIYTDPETNTLSLMWYQRSVDSILGLPFNIASYALLTHLLATTHGYQPGELIANLGDTHIYQPHMAAAKEQITREPKTLPTLTITNKRDSITDYSFNDISLEGYDPHPKLTNPTPMFGGFF